MKKEMKDKLLDRYYKGETSLEEEDHLKNEVLRKKNKIPEKDIFEYFQKEGFVPEGLENRIFEGIKEYGQKKNVFKMKWFPLASAAATFLILLTAYLGFQNIKNKKIENEFLVIEQALLQVSQSIQPDEQEEMFILWVDDDIEIIIN